MNCVEKSSLTLFSLQHYFVSAALLWEGQGVHLPPSRHTFISHPQLPWKKDSKPQRKGAEDLSLWAPSTGFPKCPHLAFCHMENSQSLCSPFQPDPLLETLKEEGVGLSWEGPQLARGVREKASCPKSSGSRPL